ncbi:MAG: glycosyltransferase family 4 protein [Negativicutes bacterium]|nr:glycosyltransferase family 4 protein [Negativicutes bacterium]
MRNIWLWNHYATDMYKNRGGRHYWFAENLIKQGYNATVFCANTYHNKAECIDTEGKKYATDTANGIPFVFVKTIPALGNGIARVKNMVLFYLNLFSAAKDYAKANGKPDVILASSVHPLTMVAGIQIAKKFKVPCICEVRDLWPEAIFSFNKTIEKSILGKILTAGEHWIYKKADALIFTKEGDTDYIEEKRWDTAHGGNVDLKKCHYINNGVDLEAFLKSTEENACDDMDLTDEKFNVVYAGAIRPVNNVGNILDAAALLRENTDIQFLIYGDGNQQEALKQRVVDEGLTNVKMKGYINKQYIPYILSKSSVNILNYSQSQYNWSRGNSSNKLFEYMASGKPVISTVKMGYCILDKYKCGLSLAEPTSEELSKTILKVHNMTKEQYEELGVNARKGVAEFDFKVLTRKLIDVIESV